MEDGLADVTVAATPALYAAVALELLRAPGHAVPVSVLHQKHGKAAAAALLEANYIALQDAAPLGTSAQDPVATIKLYRPGCAAEVFVWRRMETRLMLISSAKGGGKK